MQHSAGVDFQLPRPTAQENYHMLISVTLLSTNPKLSIQIARLNYMK